MHNQWTDIVQEIFAIIKVIFTQRLKETTLKEKWGLIDYLLKIEYGY